MAALGAVLAVMGRCLLGLLLAVLVLILIVLFVPVAIWLDYTDETLTARTGMLFFGLRVWPQKELTEEQKRKKAEKAKKKPAKKKPEKPKTSKRKLRLTFDMIVETVAGAGRLLRAILGSIHFHHLKLRLSVQGGDAAATAIQYGRVQAAIGPGFALLSQVFKIQVDELAVRPAFVPEQAEPLHFSCKITARVYAIVAGLVAFLITLWKSGLIRQFLPAGGAKAKAKKKEEKPAKNGCQTRFAKKAAPAEAEKS